MNLSHARVIQFAIDSSRYWVNGMHVDGFRFALGTVLAREPSGFDIESGFLKKAVRRDPILSARAAKTIATAIRTTARGTAASKGRPTTGRPWHCAGGRCETCAPPCCWRKERRCCSPATNSRVRSEATTMPIARVRRSAGVTGRSTPPPKECAGGSLWSLLLETSREPTDSGPMFETGERRRNDCALTCALRACIASGVRTASPMSAAWQRTSPYSAGRSRGPDHQRTRQTVQRGGREVRMPRMAVGSHALLARRSQTCGTLMCP